MNVVAAPSPKRPACLIEESSDEVFSWAKTKRPACWGRDESVGWAKPEKPARLSNVMNLLAVQSPSASLTWPWIERRSLSVVPSLEGQPDEIKWRRCYGLVELIKVAGPSSKGQLGWLSWWKFAEPCPNGQLIKWSEKRVGYQNQKASPVIGGDKYVGCQPKRTAYLS